MAQIKSKIMRTRRGIKHVCCFKCNVFPICAWELHHQSFNSLFLVVVVVVFQIRQDSPYLLDFHSQSHSTTYSLENLH